MEIDTPIQDAETFRNKETFGFREIVLLQVRRITNIYSRELTEGFWKKSLGELGSENVVAYIPDGRVSFCQSVECLHDLLQGKFDDIIKTSAKEIETEINELKNTLAEENKTQTVTYEMWIKKKVKLMRKMFQELCLFLERIEWLETGGVQD